MEFLRAQLVSKQCSIDSSYGLDRLRKERATSELHQRLVSYSKEPAGCHLLYRGSEHYCNVTSLELGSDGSLEINRPKKYLAQT